MRFEHRGCTKNEAAAVNMEDARQWVDKGIWNSGGGAVNDEVQFRSAVQARNGDGFDTDAVVGKRRDRTRSEPRSREAVGCKFKRRHKVEHWQDGRIDEVQAVQVIDS